MNLIALVSNANCTKIVVVAAVNELFPFASKSHLCLGRGGRELIWGRVACVSCQMPKLNKFEIYFTWHTQTTSTHSTHT